MPDACCPVFRARGGSRHALATGLPHGTALNIHGRGLQVVIGHQLCNVCWNVPHEECLTATFSLLLDESVLNMKRQLLNNRQKLV